MRISARARPPVNTQMTNYVQYVCSPASRVHCCCKLLRPREMERPWYGARWEGEGVEERSSGVWGLEGTGRRMGRKGGGVHEKEWKPRGSNRREQDGYVK